MEVRAHPHGLHAAASPLGAQGEGEKVALQAERRVGRGKMRLVVAQEFAGVLVRQNFGQRLHVIVRGAAEQAFDIVAAGLVFRRPGPGTHAHGDDADHSGPRRRM